MRGCMGTSDPAAACVTFRSANPARVYFLVRALSNLLRQTHFFLYARVRAQDVSSFCTPEVSSFCTRAVSPQSTRGAQFAASFSDEIWARSGLYKLIETGKEMHSFLSLPLLSSMASIDLNCTPGFDLNIAADGDADEGEGLDLNIMTSHI
jgi:hypothetical protein